MPSRASRSMLGVLYPITPVALLTREIQDPDVITPDHQDVVGFLPEAGLGICPTFEKDSQRFGDLLLA